jgi:SPP1 family predicted phage head-tail adaptor
MKLGEMRHRVTIEAEPTDPAVNSLGEQPEGWAPVCVVWAAIETLSGRELYREVQVQPEATHKVEIRYRKGISSDMRIIHQGRKLNIYRVDDPGERHEKLELYCTEAK